MINRVRQSRWLRAGWRRSTGLAKPGSRSSRRVARRGGGQTYSWLEVLEPRVLLSSVGDTVWLDGNPNGRQDEGEHGFADVTVNLYESGGQAPVATLLTEVDGSYLFDGLNSGDYFVEFIAPEGFDFTDPDIGNDADDSDAGLADGRSPVFTLGESEDRTNVDAGLVNTTGRVFVYVDFTRDTNNFFDTLAKRDLMRLAANTVVAPFEDDLDPIIVSGTNEWNATFSNPATGALVEAANPVVAQNELIFFVGGQQLGELGFGGPGGFNASGSQTFLDLVRSRGEAGALLETPTDFGGWGGAVTFNTEADWFFGETIDGMGATQNDFFSVAVHETVHGLGFGTSASFDALIQGFAFTGPTATALFDGDDFPPLTADGAHWDQELLDEGATPVMVPFLLQGTRNVITPLDFAALEDMGWEVASVEIPPGSIAGAKFNDLDGDGVRDAGEPGLAGVTIFVDLNGNNTLEGGEPSAVTDEQGDYLITGVQPGQRTVAEQPPDGFVQTFPAGDPGVHVVNVGSDETVTGIDFGNMFVPVPTPQVAVTLDGAPIEDGQAGAIDFGVVLVGEDPLTRTFTVSNAGTADLTLGDVALPIGFELTESLDSVIAPGGSDDFTVTMAAALPAGQRAGQLSFTTNVDGVSPFDFPITAEVTDKVLDEGFDASQPGDLFEGDATIVDDGSGNNVLQLTEGSDAAFSRVLDLPLNAETLTFDYRVTQAGAGDQLFVSLDGGELTRISLGQSSAVFQSAGLIDIVGLGGAPATLELRLASVDPTNAQVQVDNLVVTAGEFEMIHFNGDDKAEYLDGDGDTVGVALRGAGEGQVVVPKGGGDAIAIMLDGSDTKSSLTISTTRGNQTTVKNIVVNGDLNAIAAKTTDVLGNVTITGGLKKAQFDDVAHDHLITIGAPVNPRDQVTLTFDNLQGVVIDSQSPIKGLTATQWLQGPDGDDAIIAPFVNKVSIKGSSRDGIPGHFEAGFDLSGQGAAKTTLNALSVKGDLRDAAFNIVGDVGGVKVSGDVEDVAVNLMSSVKSFAFDDATNLTFNVDGDAGKIKGDNWVGGGVTAQTLPGLTLKGDGDLNLILTGSECDCKPSLGNTKISGRIGPSAWQLTDVAQGITAGSIDPAWSGTFDSLNKLTVAEDLTGVITAADVGTVTAKGAISDFTMRVVNGVKKLTAAAISNSTIFIGLPDTQTSLPIALDEFDNPDGELVSLTLKGVRGSTEPALVNSLIAAARFGSIKLAEVDIDNAGVELGIAGDFYKSLSFESNGQGVRLTNAETPDLSQQVGDFVARVI